MEHLVIGWRLKCSIQQMTEGIGNRRSSSSSNNWSLVNLCDSWFTDCVRAWLVLDVIMKESLTLSQNKVSRFLTWLHVRVWWLDHMMTVLRGLCLAALWHLCAKVLWESTGMTLQGLLSLWDLGFCTFCHVKGNISQQIQLINCFFFFAKNIFW